MQLPFFDGPVAHAGLLGAQYETWTFPEEMLSKPAPDGGASLAAQLTGVLSKEDLQAPETMSKVISAVAWLPWPYSYYAVCALKFNREAFPLFIASVEKPEDGADPMERDARAILASRMEQWSRARILERVFAPGRMTWILQMLASLRAETKKGPKGNSKGSGR